ncbi:MAG: hypothetical protein LBF27_14065 [Sphingobacterium sp.]|jgi:hypothetical protein|nr:hypothetical protein [Sphingobacterium sp.]
MNRVPFTPSGIALKQHELYGLDDNQLQLEATHLYANIVDWSMQHFILDDDQINWLNQQDDKFTVEFAMKVAKGISLRYDINIQFVGPDKPVPKSKNISARENEPYRSIDITVHKSDE